MKGPLFTSTNGVSAEVPHQPNPTADKHGAPRTGGEIPGFESPNRQKGESVDGELQTERSSLPQPISELEPKRKVDLTLAVLPGAGDITEVETLEVRELKGIGSQFTPFLEGALILLTVAYKPKGKYQTDYQILGPRLTLDTRAMRKASRVAYIPTFSWSTSETVIMPIKLTAHGLHVIEALKKLKSELPNVKAFVEWNEARNRHDVYRSTLSDQEQELVQTLTWPTKQEMLTALSDLAFDTIEDLAAANDDVRTILRAVEVE